MWRSQTHIGQQNPPRSRQAVTDRPTMEPPLTSAETPGSAGQGQVDERIFMSLFRSLPVYGGAWQRPLVWPGPGAGPLCTNADL